MKASRDFLAMRVALHALLLAEIACLHAQTYPRIQRRNPRPNTRASRNRSRTPQTYDSTCAHIRLMADNSSQISLSEEEQ